MGGLLGESMFFIQNICGMGLSFKLDGFRILYGLTASFMWLMTALFSWEYMKHYKNKVRYYVFTLITYLATMGVFLSADLYTTFIFFEIMSLSSYVWVVHDETKEAVRAADTYLAISIIGGLVMLMGLFLLYYSLGTLEIDALREAVTARSSLGYLYPAGICLFIGFGAKAGAFPLHIWLPKAHPVAPAPASALLSGILTKAGIFGILIISCRIFWHDGRWGTFILIVGTITMFLGAILAMYSINIKRSLACSSLSQIGFIMVGIGMTGLLGEENGLAVRGSLLHMVNHSLIKLVLFMAAGVIYMNIHKLDLNDIQGFGRNKPLFHFIFLAGALGIGGIPLFNGYVSKTLLHESIVEYRNLISEGVLMPTVLGPLGITVIEWIFLISGGLTIAYMTKLYVCVFVEKNKDVQVQAAYDNMKKTYMNPVSIFALTLSAVIVAVSGIMPSLTMNKIADMGQSFLEFMIKIPDVSYFSFSNLKGAFISVCIGSFVYFMVVRKYMMEKGNEGQSEYCNRLDSRLDLENLIYRPFLLKIFPFIGAVVSRTGDSLADSIIVFLRKTIYKDSPLPYELREGTEITHMIGSLFDHTVYLIRKILSVGKEKKPQYKNHAEHKLATAHAIVSEYMEVVTRSMSFGLFLFCIGFIMIVVYLLYHYEFRY